VPLQDTNGIENFVKNFAKSYYTWDNSKEAIEARTQAISGYLTKELQDLNVDTIRTDIPTSSTVTDVIVWHIEQSGADTFSATYEVDQQIKEGEQTSNVKANILGDSRINGLKTMIGNEVKKGNGFRDLNTYAQGCNGYLSAENRIKYLEMQLAYKDQEIEFLKKIVSLNPEAPE